MSNPFLNLPDVDQSSSNNPFLNLPDANTSPQVSNIQSFLAGTGQQLAKIGENTATTVASGLDKLGLTNNSAQSIHEAFDKNVYPFYDQYTKDNSGATFAGNIAGGIIGSAPALLNAPGKLLQFGTGAASGYLNSDPNAGVLQKGTNALIGGGLNMLPGGAALATTLGGAAGAGYGYVTDGNIGKDAAIGAGTALGLYGANKYGKDIPFVTRPIGNIIRGLDPTITNPSDLAQIATQKTLEQVGGDLGKATPEMFFKNADKLTEASRIVKNQNYDSLYKLADDEGVSVVKNNLANLANDLQAQVSKGATSDTIKALSETKKLLGQPEVIKTQAGKILNDEGNLFTPANTTIRPQTATYRESYDLVRDIGGQINEARVAGNDTLANKLNLVKSALLQDIKEGGGSDALQQLKTNADDFYKNVYAPLKDINARKVLTDKFVDSVYMANALKSTMRDPNYLKAFRAANANGLDNNLENTMLAAHVNAVKAASTTDGMINPTKYANTLSQSVRDNPVLFAPIVDKLTSLGNALQVAQQAQGLRAGLSEHSVGQKFLGSALGLGGGGAGLALGGPMLAAVTGTSSFLLPKSKYFYVAGKMLRDPQTAALLQTGSKISDKTDPNVAQLIYKRISDKFNRYSAGIPLKILNIMNATSSSSAATPQQ